MANIIEVTITATGPQGEDGADGVGVPTGGTAGQVLTKVDGSDYNTEWASDNDKINLTNKIYNGHFHYGTAGWLLVSSTVSVNAGELTLLASALSGRFYQALVPLTAGVYYTRALVKATSNLVTLDTFGGGTLASHSGSNNYEVLSGIETLGAAVTQNVPAVRDRRTSGWDNIFVKDYIKINLTEIFGAGNEPTKEYMDNLTNARYKNIHPQNQQALYENNVIESGSNENGSWVRYADGTQICWFNAVLVYGATSRLQLNTTLPVSFIDTPIGMVSKDASSVASNIFRGSPGISLSTGSSTVRLFATGTDTYASGDTATLQCIVIGRWK